MLYLPTSNTSLVGTQPVGRQYNPMMDFNSDQAINGLDLWILKTWYFSSEGAGPGAMNQPDAPQLSYIHFEHRGAPIGVSNESGDMVWQVDYRPFGEVEELTDVDGGGEAFALNLRYPGQYLDRESGYYYNYFRYYDPLTGRYVTSDPIGLDGGLNTYAYVQGNPLLYTDPDGQFFELAALASPTTWAGIAAITAGWLYINPTAVPDLLDALHNESADDEDCPPVDDDTVEEEYDSLEAAVGSVNPLEDVEYEGKTKNPGLRDQGYTEKWTGVDSDGKYQSAFRNPRTGKWTGGHESSKNDKYW